MSIEHMDIPPSIEHIKYVEKVRFHNLRLLMDRGYLSRKDLNKLNMSDPRISQLLGKNPKLPINRKWCDLIEAAFVELPSGWLDEFHDENDADQLFSKSDRNLNSVMHMIAKIPVYTLETVPARNRDDYAELSDGRISPDAFIVRFVGDAMENYTHAQHIKSGDFCVFEPHKKPEHGCVALIRLKPGENAIIRRYVEDDLGNRAAVAVNKFLPPENQRIELTDQAEVLGVKVRQFGGDIFDELG